MLILNPLLKGCEGELPSPNVTLNTNSYTLLLARGQDLKLLRVVLVSEFGGSELMQHRLFVNIFE